MEIIVFLTNDTGVNDALLKPLLTACTYRCKANISSSLLSHSVGYQPDYCVKGVLQCRALRITKNHVKAYNNYLHDNNEKNFAKAGSFGGRDIGGRSFRAESYAPAPDPSPTGLHRFGEKAPFVLRPWRKDIASPARPVGSPARNRHS